MTIFYKGYKTITYFDVEEKIWYGKIEDTQDLICFHSENEQNILLTFREAVDDYLNDKQVAIQKQKQLNFEEKLSQFCKENFEFFESGSFYNSILKNRDELLKILQ